MSFAVFMVTFLLRLWQKCLISKQQIVPATTTASIIFKVDMLMVQVTHKCAEVRVLISEVV